MAVERSVKVETVLAMVLDGAKRPEIMAFCLEEWGSKQRTVDRLMADAWHQHGDATSERRIRERGRMAEFLLKQMRVADKGGKVKAAVAACVAYCKLYGLNAPEVVEHKVTEAWREIFDQFGIRSVGEKKPDNGDGRIAH